MLGTILKKISFILFIFITIFYFYGVLQYALSKPAKTTYNQIFSRMLNNYIEQHAPEENVKFIYSSACSDDVVKKCIPIFETIGPRISCSPWTWRKCVELRISLPIDQNPRLSGHILSAFANICSPLPRFRETFNSWEKYLVGCERNPNQLSELSIRFMDKSNYKNNYYNFIMN